MAQDVLINVGAGETRVAVVADGRLEEFYLERTIGPNALGGRAGRSLLGNIIIGRVQRVLPGMQAAFVDVGLERAGFLGAKEARCLADLPSFHEGAAPCISKLLLEGQALLVQVVKDPIGDKGARLSANVTLPGRLLVFVPNQRGLALSRRIEDEAERARLQAIVERLIANGEGRFITGAGYIVRTAAVGRDEAELAEDAERLAEAWRALALKRQGAHPPATLYYDLDTVERTLRDFVDDETGRVLIDDPDAFAQAKAYAARAMPEAEARVTLHNGPDFLFDLYDLEPQIEALLRPRVGLRCGGWITIETTEALTAIDVNSGSLTDTTGLEETSVRTNLDAAAEIGRQLRLRGIGGLVVIDFIHMGDPENIACVLQTLAMGLGRDRVPTQISCFSEFGLVELTRKRTRDPLLKCLTEPLEGCYGGRIKTVETLGCEVLRRLEREARARPGRALTVCVGPELAGWFGENAASIEEALRRRGVARYVVDRRESWPRMRHDIAEQRS
ncbi:MAG: Rne/Rng family ribonuclease [Alphaproteobacteria bacterium]|nr:Rne/Rng family ribonuclease [Alphaproteobacteria bacterium]